MTPDFSSQTVLITGAAGFIGSNLTQTLLEAGAQVIGVDNFVTGQQSNIDQFATNTNFTFIEADVTQAPESYLPSGMKLDLILHFASPASPPRYQAHPVNTYLVNSYATHLLLQYLKEHHPQARFLFASTSEVYGDPLEHPQTEKYWGNVNPNGVRSCYDEAKRLGESICGVHERDFGLDVRIVRIFNTYGPNMDPADGRVIPQFISEALAGQELSVFGDGSQTRSYCYVDDLVAGILALASHPQGKGLTVNLGNPGEYTVLQTAQEIWKLLHGETPAKIAFKPLPKDDPTRRRPDITLAQTWLGWEPQITLQAGLAKTLPYFKKQLGYT
jgi:nucleoside-diphosphate-sugar epimerase